MQISKTLYVKNRKEWRKWLEKNHDKEPEIWIIYYKKHSNKARIPYDDSVEEALCFGWIDSTVKAIDGNSYAQRFSPRRKNSNWSEPNKERVIRLFYDGQVTQAGPRSLDNDFRVLLEKSNRKLKVEKVKVSKDILAVLKKDPAVWKNFENFPETYKRIRIAWIEASHSGLVR